MKLKSLVLFILSLTLVVPLYAQSAQPDFTDRPERVVVGAPPSLVGAWVLDVKLVASPPFRALQTFHANGTMSETSDLLANLGEGPGQGGWMRTEDGGYTATFELFIFEADHAPAGRIRVRENLKVNGDKITGDTVADLILPDGTLIENIDSGPVTGTKVRVLPVKPEELNSVPANSAYTRGW